MANVALQNIAAAGITPSYAAVNSTDTINGVTGNERVFLHVKNAGGSSCTVAIAPVSPTAAKVPGVGNVSIPSISVAVPSSTGDKMIGPIPAAYIDQSGNVTVTYSFTTSVTAAALSLPAASL